MRSHLSIVLGSILAVALVGVASGRVSAAAPAAEETQKVVVHLSHFTDDLHAGFMALKVANALQKHGASVTLFIDLEGARLAHRHNNLAIRWGESDATLGQLFDQFVKAGGRAVVCPHCAHHAGVLRLLDAVQTSQKHQVATPENWQPGDPVIVPPPKTVADAKARLDEGYDCVAYLNGDHT